MSTNQDTPPPKRQNMTRISSLTAAHDSWLPKSINYPRVESISDTVASSRPIPAPVELPPAVSIGRQEGGRAIGPHLAAPVSKQFETATIRAELSTDRKWPFRRPRKQCFNDDVRLVAYEPDALPFAVKQRMGRPRGCRRLLFHGGTRRKGCRAAFPSGFGNC